jgi:hypothetical protein
VLKVLEGKWPANTGTAAPERAPTDPLERERRMLRGYRPNGPWYYAPIKRPEDPACQMNRDLLEEWRKRHGVKVEERPVETAEQRIEAMIGSYTRIGNHAKADALRVELAQLRGESLVTLPPRPEPHESKREKLQPPPVVGAEDGHPYRQRPSEAETTRAMAQAVDAEYEMLEPEAENFGDE